MVPEPTAQPAIEEIEKTKKLEGAGTRQPCGRVVGIIRRNWREKQYCGSLRVEGDRAVASGKGQSTSALFMPVDRKVNQFGIAFVNVSPCPSFCERVYTLQKSLARLILVLDSVRHVILRCTCSTPVLQIPWVRIQTRQRDVLSTKRILVAMDSWPAWCKYPLGHYVKTLGEKGAKATETEVGMI